jgi:hypothetical protein
VRQLIYTALQADTTLAELMPAPRGEAGPARIYQWGSLGQNPIPAKPEFPFLLISEQPMRVNHAVRSEKSTTRTFYIYCYAQHGEGYVQIENILLRVRDTLLGLIAQVSPSGARCTDVKWTGMSVDSRDPEYVANMRFASFTFVSQR